MSFLILLNHYLLIFLNKDQYKKHIYELARKSYFAVIEDGDGGEDDFIHTEQFVLIDKERRIRGFYDGTDLKDMEKLKQDMVLLKAEYEN